MSNLNQKHTLMPGDIVEVNFDEAGGASDIYVERGKVMAVWLTPKGAERAIVLVDEHADVNEYLWDDKYLGKSFVVAHSWASRTEWYAVHQATTVEPSKRGNLVPLTVYGYSGIGEICECRGTIIRQWRTWNGNVRAIIHACDGEQSELINRAYFAKPFDGDKWWALHRREVKSLPPAIAMERPTLVDMAHDKNEKGAL